MNHRDRQHSGTAQSVRNAILRRIGTRDAGIPGFTLRSAARSAVSGARHVSGGAAHLGRDAVVGAVQAIEEIGGEAGSMVRDTMIGVIEGANQVVAITAPAISDMVAGAIHSSTSGVSDTAEVGREAIEGAIVGAVAVGMESRYAAASAVSGAVEAMMEAGTETADAVRATVSGVVSGVAATDGDVSAAAEAATYAMIAHGADEGTDPEDIASRAEHAVDAALAEVAENPAVDMELVAATATGAVAAAYELGPSHGDHVRRSVLLRLSASAGRTVPELAHQTAHLGERLAQELPRGRAAWRGRAVYRAARVLVHDGGIDMAASLAYFTVMSFFPMMALVAMAVAFFADPEVVGAGFSALIVQYFPASADLLREAIQHLFQGTLAMGLVALAATLIGANGLFVAADRAVNRLFGVEHKGFLSTTLSEAAIATSVIILFTLSMMITALFQVGLGFQPELTERLGPAAAYLLWPIGAISALIPAVITGLLFTAVYHYVPSVPVHWRDASYGGLVAMTLFEIGKHLFFWMSTVATQRSVIYGPVAAFVVLLMWCFLAGLIFLYGAALTRAAGELRPDRQLSA